MKTLWFFAVVFLFAAFQYVPAYADVAVGAVYTFAVAVPLLLLAILIIATALIVRAIRKRKNNK